MSVKIVARTKDSFTVQIETPYSEAMVPAEDVIQEKLNEESIFLTGEVSEKTDSSPTKIGYAAPRWSPIPPQLPRVDHMQIS